MHILSAEIASSKTNLNKRKTRGYEKHVIPSFLSLHEQQSDMAIATCIRCVLQEFSLVGKI